MRKGTDQPFDLRKIGTHFLVMGAAVLALTAGSLTGVGPVAMAAIAPTGVHITGTGEARRLLVNGRPWQVRGVTYGPAQADAAKWLPDISAMGANTVRTWGVDAGTPTLLRSAAKRHMRVIVGQWLPYDVDWVHDSAAKVRLRAQVLEQVRTLRGSEGVLAWGLGNEVMLNQGARGGSSAITQRVAYAHFVDELAQAVHRVDRNHPVLSVEAIPRDWPILARYAPHLDVIGVNAYRGITDVDTAFHTAHITKPYIVTETGPVGSWEESGDPLGGPADNGDGARISQMMTALKAATAHPGRSLGVVAFHYGTDADISGIRFGLRTLGFRRAGWYAVQRAYLGHTTGGAPRITQAKLLTPTVAPEAEIRVAIKADRSVRWSALRTPKPWGAGEGLETVKVQQLADGVLQLRAPRTPGIHRVVLVADNGRGAAGMQTVTLRVRNLD